MAEDLLWWASIGSAFVRRMEKNGLLVRRISPFGTPPEDAAEVIPCSWEGELIGRLVIELPGEDGAEIAEVPLEQAKEAKRRVRAPKDTPSSAEKNAPEEETAPAPDEKPPSDNPEAPSPPPDGPRKNRTGRRKPRGKD
jgi:hypothetical protein